MEPFLNEYITEILIGIASFLAVGASLLRARAMETEASAKAVSELSEVSQDLRERIHQLEEENQAKDAIIAELRQETALIPLLEAQIAMMKQELGEIKRYSS